MICWICQRQLFVIHSPYISCQTCGHMVLEYQDQTYIENDPIDIESIKKSDIRIQFQLKVSNSYIGRNKKILDIGCGPGKFLYHVQPYVESAKGVEVTPSCVDFSRKQLGLDVRDTIQSFIGHDERFVFDLVTAWHSFEHIPVPALQEILAEINLLLAKNGRIIVSVPNAASIQWRIYSKNWLYYDVPNHLHQFSYDSLILFFQNAGFKREREWFSFAYNFFGHLMSFANLFSTRFNFLYYVFKRQSSISLSKSDYIQNITLSMLGIVLGVLPAAVLTLIETMTLKNAGVITLCFKKN